MPDQLSPEPENLDLDAEQQAVSQLLRAQGAGVAMPDHVLHAITAALSVEVQLRHEGVDPDDTSADAELAAMADGVSTGADELDDLHDEVEVADGDLC